MANWFGGTCAKNNIDKRENFWYNGDIRCVKISLSNIYKIFCGMLCK